MNAPSPPTPSAFSQLVLELRTRRGLSQTTVARDAGVSPGYIGGIETGARGRRPSYDKVIAIAQGLHATDAEAVELLRAAGYIKEGQPLVPPGRATFEQFVMAEPLLRNDQKRALISTYQTYRRARPANGRG